MRESVGANWPSCPSVTLSPNAMKRVRPSVGSTRTVTVNPHDDDRPAPSDAVHVTFVVPGAKSVPLAGLQLTETGTAPPAATGVWNATASGAPPVVGESMLAGQATVGACGAGGGVIGLSLHAGVAASSRQTAARRCPHRRMGGMIEGKFTVKKQEFYPQNSLPVNTSGQLRQAAP
jgi:hypothetical protein